MVSNMSPGMTTHTHGYNGQNLLKDAETKAAVENVLYQTKSWPEVEWAYVDALLLFYGCNGDSFQEVVLAQHA